MRGGASKKTWVKLFVGLSVSYFFNTTYAFALSGFQNQTEQSLFFSVDEYLNSNENSSDKRINLNLNKKYSIVQNQNINIDLELLWSHNEESLFTAARNLNYEIISRNLQITFGIKKLDWSESLSFFNSTEWEPQQQRNRLHPVTGGNLGLFYTFFTEKIKFNFLYSPYFLPHTGPDVDFENGELISRSPWVIRPPGSVPYEGQDFSTKYYLEDPDLANFLNEQNLSFNAQAQLSEKMDMNVSYARKPNPRFMLDLDFRANVANPNVPIDVFIKPRVVTHELLSVDLEYKIKPNSSFILGYTTETNESFKLPNDDQTFQVPIDQTVFSLIYNYQNKSFKTGLGLIYREGGRSRSIGELDTALADQNINYLYEQAIKFDFTYFESLGWQLNASSSYDIQQKGFITTAFVQRKINNASIQLGFDALEPLRNADKSSFIYQYRNLDRIWAGMSYVF